MYICILYLLYVCIYIFLDLYVRIYGSCQSQFALNTTSNLNLELVYSNDQFPLADLFLKFAELIYSCTSMFIYICICKVHVLEIISVYEIQKFTGGRNFFFGEIILK